MTVGLFVSYTRADEALVHALADDLERMGQHTWLDQQIHGGERWWQEIIRQIQDADVFLFALSKDSLKSQPCRAERRYADELWVPVLPIQVGPVENLSIPIGEKQIIDYRERSADAVIGLISAISHLGARPRQLPDPMPEPPPVPFEYLFRLARQIDVQEISRRDQGLLISELRRLLKEEEDDAVARNDILSLLKELKNRPEITVGHAAEIDEVLGGTDPKKVPQVGGGATRLPPADHWRRGRSGAEADAPRTGSTESEPPKAAPTAPRTGGSSASSEGSSRTAPPGRSEKETAEVPPERPAKKPSTWAESSNPPQDPGASRGSARPPDGASPTAEGEAPAWLTSIIDRGGGKGTGSGGKAAGTTHPTSADDTPPRTSTWWPEEQSAAEPPAASTVKIPTAAAPPTPVPTPLPVPPAGRRFAFVGAVLGAMGIPFLILSLPGFIPVVVTLLLLSSTLGLSMSVVAATRREPQARIAVALGVVGLLGAIVFAARAFS